MTCWFHMKHYVFEVRVDARQTRHCLPGERMRKRDVRANQTTQRVDQESCSIPCTEPTHGVEVRLPRRTEANASVAIDSDHGGCVFTSRSTSGGSNLHGAPAHPHVESMHCTIILSSAESEYYATLKGDTDKVLVKNLYSELKMNHGTAKMRTDSIEIREMATLKGVGALRIEDAQVEAHDQEPCQASVNPNGA